MVVIRHAYYQVVFIPDCVNAYSSEELLPKGCAQLEQLRSKVKDELFFFVWFCFLTLWRFSDSAK